jgi:transposase
MACMRRSQNGWGKILVAAFCSFSATVGTPVLKSSIGTGLWLLTKRLEKGTFSWPKQVEPGVTKLKLTPQALAMLTDGVDLRGVKLRPWYEREN